MVDGGQGDVVKDVPPTHMHMHAHAHTCTCKRTCMSDDVIMGIPMGIPITDGEWPFA